MKIAVGLPSLNEEDTIAAVVRTVDFGLSHYYPDSHRVIINIDSSSDDRTSSVFLDTHTQATKKSIVLPPPRGKGSNIINFISTALILRTDVFAIFDTDVTSIEPWWIKALFAPVVDCKADFTVPSYSRNRYEASTTNHFAYPFIASQFEQPIRQPIGGEFAFNRKFAKYVSTKTVLNETKRYGIDIHLTAHALGGNFIIKEVLLGRKMHKPSFPNISRMFPEVVQSALWSARDYHGSKVLKEFLIPSPESSGTDEEHSFPHATKVKRLLDDAYARCIHMQRFQPHVSASVLGSASIESRFWSRCSSEEWVDILSKAIDYGISSRCNLLLDNVGEVLYPMFVRRVCSFWNEIEGITAQEVESKVCDQAAMLFKEYRDI